MGSTRLLSKYAHSATKCRNTTGETLYPIGRNLQSRSGTILSNGDTGSTIPCALNAESERRNNVNG